MSSSSPSEWPPPSGPPFYAYRYWRAARPWDGDVWYSTADRQTAYSTTDWYFGELHDVRALQVAFPTSLEVWRHGRP